MKLGAQLAVARSLPSWGRRLVILTLLATLIAVVYLPVRNHAFLDWDDNSYLRDNPNMRGLSWENIRRAVTSDFAGYWIPVTVVSHLLDVSLFGLDPGWHHLTNVLLHTVGAIVLYLALEALTGCSWPSAFVAALFAVHPLHVESVAWVAERKDVLSGLFCFLTLSAYAHYARRPGWRRYLTVVAPFALGLMAKPMLVTLPFVLLLLDWWPLGRVGNGQGTGGTSMARLSLEKTPFLALALVAGAVTFFAAKSCGTVRSPETFPLPIRVGNAVLSYLLYLRDMIWPADIAFFYPHPGPELSGVVVAAAGTALAVATLTVILLRRRYLVTGWFWYLGTLVPVIGLVQVGYQARADRFTYLPLLGIYIIVAWGAAELTAGRRCRKIALSVLAVSVIVALAAMARVQVGYWRDNLSLFSRGVELYPESWIGRTVLGVALSQAGRPREAIEHLAAVVRLKPGYGKGWLNLGVVYEKLGLPQEAVRAYEEAIRVNPLLPEARFNLGLALVSRGDQVGAQRQYQALLSTDRAWAERLAKFLDFGSRVN